MGNSAYMVALNLSSFHVLVVGGGKIAARKIGALPEGIAGLRVVAPVIGEEVVELVLRSPWKAELIERSFEEQDLDGFELVFAASSDSQVNSRVSMLAVQRGILVNNVSASAESSFSNVAVVSKGGLSVGVSSYPRVPGFSKAISRLIEDALPAGVDKMLDLAAEVRSKTLDSGRSTDGLDWMKVLNSGVFELIRSGDLARAEESMAECLS